jgi:hypothetical protein
VTSSWYARHSIPAACEGLKEEELVGTRIAIALVALSVLASSLSACGPAATPTAAQPPATQLAPSASATQAVGVDPPAATPTARAGLEASDPTTVNLTSGRPALVEFFAFW